MRSLELGHATNPQEWPHRCIYFVDELMHAEGVKALLSSDAEFHPPNSNATESVTVLDITRSGSSAPWTLASEVTWEDKLGMTDLHHGDARVIFAAHKRVYPRDNSFNRYRMKYSTWTHILSTCEVPPDAIELIHENGGGWGVHSSYCSDVGSTACSLPTTSPRGGSPPCAYHIWLKPRPWWNEEHFLYARLDHHTGQKVILVTGTGLGRQIQRLSSQFRSAGPSNLFAIILALISTWTKDLEGYIWEQDFATQRLESNTGWSSLGHTQLWPLPLEKLGLRKDMALAKEQLSHALFASESFAQLWIFLAEQVEMLPSQQRDISNRDIHIRTKQIKDAFLQCSSRQWHMKSQVLALTARVDLQWNVVSALVAQHSNSLNYQVAADSRIDTVVMRRISFVTMVFLPATFLATFFSMTFFQVTADEMKVSPMIWIYAVCVVPITLVLSWLSSTRGSSRLEWIGSKAPKQRKTEEMLGKTHS